MAAFQLPQQKPEKVSPDATKDFPWSPIHYSVPGAVWLSDAGKGDPSTNYEQKFAARIAALTGGDKPTFVTATGHAIPIDALPNSYSGGEVVCGFRPESVTLGGETPLPAIVGVVEPTGSETHVFARLGDADIVAVLRERITLPPGAPLPISVAPGGVHLFDAKTSKRLN